MSLSWSLLRVACLPLLVAACTSNPGDTGISGSNGGATATSSGGASSGGAAATSNGGVATASGGTTAAGGTSNSGGAAVLSGGATSGGAAAAGGANFGGNAASGGATTAGGSATSGGANTGGSSASGGNTNAGGTSASGGATNTAGTNAGGTAGAGTGGTVARGGAAGSGSIDISGPPFTVKSGLFDQTKVDDLGLAAATGLETFTIFRPTDQSDHYSNGVVLTSFKGMLYAQWQSSATDEDSADTWTAYARSSDGKTWSAPIKLAAASSDRHRTSGGWWVSGDTLVAYVNVWPTSLSPRGGYVEYMTSTDGVAWSAAKAVTMSDGSALLGVFEQDPHALPDGRIINAAHFQPGLLVAPCYTDNASGVAGWKRAPFTSLAATTTTREMEPSWYLRSDGAVVMVFRDQETTYRKLASVSADRGATWTTPVLTDMPDSRAKQSAGNLPSGVAYFVSNPVTNKTRAPLAVTISRDGRLFDRAFTLRKGGSDLQAQRYTGTSKGLGYSYPKSMVANGYLYVGYATNKEDVQLTRVPLTSLAY
ncbi:MAG: exo-alpha-sialidase [Polyangiaceae bacterium]